MKHGQNNQTTAIKAKCRPKIATIFFITAAIALFIGAYGGLSPVKAADNSFFKIGQPTKKPKKTFKKTVPAKRVKKRVKKSTVKRRRIKRRRVVRHTGMLGLRLGWSRRHVERLFSRRGISAIRRTGRVTVYGRALRSSHLLDGVWLMFISGRLAKIMMTYSVQGNSSYWSRVLKKRYDTLRTMLVRRYGNPSADETFHDSRVPETGLALASGMSNFYSYWHEEGGGRMLLALGRYNSRPVLTLSYQHIALFEKLETESPFSAPYRF